jgi:hypothetical protein
MGKSGHQDGGKVEGADKRAGDKLWPDSHGYLGQFSFGIWRRRASGREGNTVGIEGNHCRLRHRIRRVFRRTCCFSKGVLNHLKAFDMAFFYINYGFV